MKHGCPTNGIDKAFEIRLNIVKVFGLKEKNTINRIICKVMSDQNI